MADNAAAIADQSVQTRSRRRSLVWAVAPVAGLVLVDAIFSVLAFVLAYVSRQHAPALLWSPASGLPVGLAKAAQEHAAARRKRGQRPAPRR